MNNNAISEREVRQIVDTRVCSIEAIQSTHAEVLKQHDERIKDNAKDISNNVKDAKETTKAINEMNISLVAFTSAQNKTNEIHEKLIDKLDKMIDKIANNDNNKNKELIKWIAGILGAMVTTYLGMKLFGK